MVVIFSKTMTSLAAFLLLALPVAAQDKASLRNTINPEINKILEKHLADGLDRYDAVATFGLVMDAKSGEILGSVSKLEQPNEPTDLNLISLQEFGSVAKIVTVAAALDVKKVTLDSKLDVTQSLKIGRHTIDDINPQRRIITVEEAITYSSNIGTAKIALGLGHDYQRLFHRSLGLRDQIADGTMPIVADQKRKLTTATIGFGFGFAVSPLHAASVFATLTSKDGRVVRPIFEKSTSAKGHTIIDPETASKVRYLLRKNVEVGAAKALDFPKIKVGAMTNTANKIKDGRYSTDHFITSVIAIMPHDDPEFVVVVVINDPMKSDNPKGLRSSAWNAGKVMAGIIPELSEKLTFRVDAK